MRKLLLALLLLPIGLEAKVKYAATWDGFSTGTDLTDNVIGTSDEGYWTVSFQTTGTATIENNAGFGSNVAAIVPSGSTFASAANTKNAYTNLYVESRNDGPRSMLCIRWAGGKVNGQPTTGYCIDYYHSITQLTIFKCTASGLTTQLTSKSISVSNVDDYTLKIHMLGQEITAYLDGVEELTTSDATYSSGGFGFVSFSGRNDFDDIILDDLNPNYIRVPDHLKVSDFIKVPDLIKSTPLKVP